MRQNFRATSAGAGAGPGNGSWAWRGQGRQRAGSDRPGSSHSHCPPPRRSQAHPRQGPPRLLPVRGVLGGLGLPAEVRLRGAAHLGPRGSRLPSPDLLPRRPRGGGGGGRGDLLLPVPPRFLGAEEERSHSQPDPESESMAPAASHPRRYLPLGLRAVLLGWDTLARLRGCLHLGERRETTTHVRNFSQQSHS